MRMCRLPGCLATLLGLLLCSGSQACPWSRAATGAGAVGDPGELRCAPTSVATSVATSVRRASGVRAAGGRPSNARRLCRPGLLVSGLLQFPGSPPPPRSHRALERSGPAGCSCLPCAVSSALASPERRRWCDSITRARCAARPPCPAPCPAAHGIQKPTAGRSVPARRCLWTECNIPQPVLVRLG
jgi:hypothetical protein